MAVEVALPEALQAEVVPAEVAVERRGVVLALVALHVRLYDLTIADTDQRRPFVGPSA